MAATGGGLKQMRGNYFRTISIGVYMGAILIEPAHGWSFTIEFDDKCAFKLEYYHSLQINNPKCLNIYGKNQIVKSLVNHYEYYYFVSSSANLEYIMKDTEIPYVLGNQKYGIIYDIRFGDGSRGFDVYCDQNSGCSVNSIR
jgi:hypothetical protein